MPVNLPADLSDEYFLYSLCQGEIDRKREVEQMTVREAVLWRHLMRYDNYLNAEYIKTHKEDS